MKLLMALFDKQRLFYKLTLNFTALNINTMKEYFAKLFEYDKHVNLQITDLIKRLIIRRK